MINARKGPVKRKRSAFAKNRDSGIFAATPGIRIFDKRQKFFKNFRHLPKMSLTNTFDRCKKYKGERGEAEIGPKKSEKRGKNTMKRLPDAEFEIMKVVWDAAPPITTATIMETLGRLKGWKAPTVISLMLRLVERGFLATEKLGRERTYRPTIGRDAYLQFETGNFMKLYHENSLTGLVHTLCDAGELDQAQLDRLEAWLRERKNAAH